MNAIQLRAYEAPVSDGRGVTEGQHNHSEVYGGVPVSVILTADIGRAGEERFGRRGAWHCSVAVWTPGSPVGHGHTPVPPGDWTPAQRRAAEKVLRRNLAGIGEHAGEGRRIAAEPGTHALHAYLPMSPAERTGLGLP
ncbi:MAG: hypothetical protein M3Q65_01245 [Chloroflexota bacterium]|nr:hypothetical protein [Chloroflexota bacterium]